MGTYRPSVVIACGDAPRASAAGGRGRRRRAVAWTCGVAGRLGDGRRRRRRGPCAGPRRGARHVGPAGPGRRDRHVPQLAVLVVGAVERTDPGDGRPRFGCPRLRVDRQMLRRSSPTRSPLSSPARRCCRAPSRGRSSSTSVTAAASWWRAAEVGRCTSPTGSGRCSCCSDRGARRGRSPIAWSCRPAPSGATSPRCCASSAPATAHPGRGDRHRHRCRERGVQEPPGHDGAMKAAIAASTAAPASRCGAWPTPRQHQPLERSPPRPLDEVELAGGAVGVVRALDRAAPAR